MPFEHFAPLNNTNCIHSEVKAGLTLGILKNDLNNHASGDEQAYNTDM
jgi:hypothetical protein